MRTRAASIIAAPLRLVRALLRSSRNLGTPLRKLTELRGKARIAAFAGIALLVVVAVVVLRPRGDSDAEVRETLDRFAQASRDKDYQTLCDDLLAAELVDRIRSAGLPCEVALRTGLEDRRNPTLTVVAVEVNDDQALARIRGSAAGEVPATATYRLVREDGEWKIATPPGGAEQEPAATP